MMLQFETVVATGTAALDSGIGDTALKTFNGETYLYSISGSGGGIVSWHLQEGQAATVQDLQYYDPTIHLRVGSSGDPVTLSTSDHLVLDVSGATGLVSYGLSSDGMIGDLQMTDTLITGGGVSATATITVGSADLLAVSHSATSQIGTYYVNADGSLTAASATLTSAELLRPLQAGSDQFLVAVEAASNTISTYSVNAAVELTGIAGNGSVDTLGINAPTAVEVIEAYGASWVVIAGSASNSLSVMKLGADGQLIPTDHALDTLHTRLGAVQDLAMIEVGDRVFIVAGGGDDGLSLFLLTPDGQLVHLDSVADSLDSGLQNVESLSMAHIGGELQIFAAAQQDAGLSQFSVDVSNLGLVAEGFGTITGSARDDMLTGGILDTDLQGGAGDDILITGTGTTTMTGGAGEDIFVIRESSGLTIVTDFEAGVDRLDMTNLSFLRSPAQLTFTSTATGAHIEYQDEMIELHAANGQPLTSSDVFGAGFDGPDHIPVNFNNTPDTNAAPGVLGAVHIDSSGPNPALVGAAIQFTPDGGSAITAQANAQGEFQLDMPDGYFDGSLDVIKSYSTASGQITALDALQVLRMAVGLDPTFGPASAENLIAADITRDGVVSALDALTVLQVAVGLPTAHEAEWVFLDASQDLSGITRSNVSYETGISVSILDTEFTADMTSILLGNIEAT